MEDAKRAFYEEVAAILDRHYEWVQPAHRKSRWYPRYPGNGRFEGYGLIRWFSPDLIQISLGAPWSTQRWCTTETALEFLRGLPKEKLDDPGRDSP